jgi:hypothetical protein
MDEGIGEDELRSRLTTTHIAQVDKFMPSPNKRAEIVWKMLQESAQTTYLSNWDVVCFSVEILGKFSQEFPWMKEAAKQINQLVYKAHYLNHDNIRQHEQVVAGVTQESSMEIPKMTGE